MVSNYLTPPPRPYPLIYGGHHSVDGSFLEWTGVGAKDATESKKSHDVDKNDAEPQKEGENNIGEKIRNRKSKKAGALLNEITPQTAVLETNKPTKKYKLSSIEKIRDNT